MYRAVILDVDGTLVDSNDAHAHAWVDAFAESGRMVPFAHVRSLIGMGSDKLLDAAVGVDADSDEDESDEDDSDAASFFDSLDSPGRCFAPPRLSVE